MIPHTLKTQTNVTNEIRSHIHVLFDAFDINIDLKSFRY